MENISGLIGDISGYQMEFQAKPVQVIISDRSVKNGKKDFEFTKRRNEIKTGIGVCSISVKKSVRQTFDYTPLERWGNETNFQPEKPEPICNTTTKMEGFHDQVMRNIIQEGLVMQGRFKAYILWQGCDL